MGSADRVTRIEAGFNPYRRLNSSCFDEGPSEIMAATREILLPPGIIQTPAESQKLYLSAISAIVEERSTTPN
jgi:hypothetical protein